MGLPYTGRGLTPSQRIDCRKARDQESLIMFPLVFLGLPALFVFWMLHL